MHITTAAFVSRLLHVYSVSRTAIKAITFLFGLPSLCYRVYFYYPAHVRHFYANNVIYVHTKNHYFVVVVVVLCVCVCVCVCV